MKKLWKVTIRYNDFGCDVRTGIARTAEEAAKKALDQQERLKLPKGYVEKVERVGDLDFQ